MSSPRHMKRLEGVDVFQQFCSLKTPRLLLCHFHDSATVQAAITALDTAIGKHLCVEGEKVGDRASLLVDAAVWDATPFPAAQRTLGIAPLSSSAAPEGCEHCDAALFIFLHDGVADRFFGSSAVADAAEDMALRLRRHLTPGATSVRHDHKSAGDVGGAALQIDVVKLLSMGKSLMAKGQAEYAEKFFVKALGVLDAVAHDAALEALVSDRSYLLTSADCLAWVLMSQLVQGRSAEHNDAARRLEDSNRPLGVLAPFPPNGDVQRALSARRLFRFAPASWRAETCSVQKLSLLLQGDPADHKNRALLVITLFLSNDIEKCLTEALKLQVLGHEFGAIALDAVTDFLGSDHELVQRLGWKRK